MLGCPGLAYAYVVHIVKLARRPIAHAAYPLSGCCSNVYQHLVTMPMLLLMHMITDRAEDSFPFPYLQFYK